MNNGENEFELSRKESKEEVDKNDTEEKGSKQTITFRERIIRFRKFITVEPFLSVFFISNSFSFVATQKFLTERECTVDLNFSADICYKIVEGIDDNSTLIKKGLVSSAIGDLYSWKQPLEKFLPAIFVLNIGAWSDRTGNRKALIIVPIIGQVLSMGSYLLGICLTNMPVWMISLTDAIVLTLTGGLSILLAGVFSYVADATEENMRTQKMGAMGVTMAISGIVGQLIGGQITQSTGYTLPVAISLVCSILGVLYTYFKIHDVDRKREEGTLCDKIVNFVHPKNFWESFSLLALSKGRKFVQILMVLSAYIILLGPYYGVFSTIYNYLLDRYSMNEVEYTWYDSTVQIISSIGTAVGVKLFTDTLKIHDCLLGIISTLCRFSSYFIYAFAPDRTWLYIGGVADFFGNIGSIVIRSLSTKIVDSGDVGKLCSIIAFTDALIVVAAVPLYTQVWVEYKDMFGGASYLLAAILTIPNFFVLFGLYYIDKKMRRDVVTDPKAKEKHVYDNEMTSL